MRMVRAKREYEGGLFAWHAAQVVAFMPMTGRQLDPNGLNPYRTQDTDTAERLRRLKQFVSNVGLAVMARKARKRAEREQKKGAV